MGATDLVEIDEEATECGLLTESIAPRARLPREGDLLVTMLFEYMWSALIAASIVGLAVMWALATR